MNDQDSQLWSLGIGRLAELIRSRSVSSVDVIQSHLDRIERVNPVLNAIVYLDADAAIKRAREIDRSLERGEDPGPLAGIPFTAKDNFEAAGMPTTLGVAERRSVVPERDATVVSRMKAAGAILLGKTNLPPWGGGLETANELHGRTNNPWNLGRTAGGSSGGEAAAIASGMSPCGLGSDSGGSVRYPAHCCGIAAIKPTAGLIPRSGLLDDVGQIGVIRDPRTQIGPMARSARDLALLMPVICGPDGRDSSCPPVPFTQSAPVSPAGMRVALQVDNGYCAPDAETRQGVVGAAQVLEELGCLVWEAPLPDEGVELTGSIWNSYTGDSNAVDLYALFKRWDDFSTRLLSWFQDYDLIIRPVDAFPALAHGETEARSLYTLPFSLTGWPSVVVPHGATREGLRLGIQIVARPWCDDLALSVATLLERPATPVFNYETDV